MAKNFKQFKLLDVATISGSRVGQFDGVKKYIATADINLNKIVSGESVSYLDRPSRADLIMTKDEVLFAKMKNTKKVLVGSLDVEDLIFSTGFYILKPNENISKKYLYFCLLSDDFNRQKDMHCSGATMAAIGHQGLKKINVSVPINAEGNPDIDEQERIALQLEEVDDLQKKRAEASQKSEKIIPALFDKMFRDGSDYTQKKLRDGIAQFKYGTSIRCDYNNKFTPILRISNVLGDQINLEDLKYGELPPNEKEKLILKEGDILFVRTNGNPNYVGRCAIFESQGEYAYASYLIRARIDKNILNPWYLTVFLRTKHGREIMRPVIRTTAGQSNINTEGLGNLIIPLPPIELQNEFAKKVKEILSLKEKQNRSSESISEVFSSLLSKSLTP